MQCATALNADDCLRHVEKPACFGVAGIAVIFRVTATQQQADNQQATENSALFALLLLLLLIFVIYVDALLQSGVLHARRGSCEAVYWRKNSIYQ